MVPSLPPARPRFLLVVILTILGGVLRFKSFGQLGLSHSDEGIYALAGAWAIAPGGLSALDPMVIPYAPPVFPILVGLSYGLFGISDGSAIVVSILCGVATIPVVAWLAWHTFGAGVDTTGAALAALALAHIALSRKALNDAPFLLAWLVAIGLGGRFLEGPRFGRALALGLAVGIAQNLKYNGWLAGSLVVLTALFGLAVRREGPTRGATLRTFGWGGCAALVAALLYRPWFEFVERVRVHGVEPLVFKGFREIIQS
ncbi:MAG TPA: glycosyltransferase family 39 protein [Isosphaeraceae bacterium]|nr:glycosyltransferase family 39 protein [Isosphaeraceae bacterium]